jgi:predicted nucleic acid-binding protein
MSAFFDTNVLVYLVDAGDQAKRAIATELVASHLRDRSLVISTQVLQELYATLLRRRFLEPEDAAEMIATLAQERVVPSTGEFVVRAVALARRYELSLWDALVVRAAIEAQCGVIFTEDLQDGMRFGELRVVNPFVLRAHEADASARRRAAGRGRRKLAAGTRPA